MAIKKKSSASARTLGSYRKTSTTSTVKRYVYPHKDEIGNPNVPDGPSSAVINKIEEATAKSGRASLDVFFTLKNDDGRTYYVRQRIPEDDGEPNKESLMTPFLDCLERAGFDIEKMLPQNVSGSVGTVYVVYPDDTDCFGQVVYSKPYVSSHRPKKATSMQELLTEDDEDEDEVDEDEPELDELDEEDVEEYLEEEE